jgi:hypothetical protein
MPTGHLNALLEHNNYTAPLSQIPEREKCKKVKILKDRLVTMES